MRCGKEESHDVPEIVRGSPVGQSDPGSVRIAQPRSRPDPDATRRRARYHRVSPDQLYPSGAEISRERPRTRPYDGLDDPALPFRAVAGGDDVLIAYPDALSDLDLAIASNGDISWIRRRVTTTLAR